MAEAITDEYVVRVLRPFVRATRPLLDALREANPFGLHTRVTGERLPKNLRNRVLALLAAVKVPGTPAWAAMDEDARCDWWANRVSRFVALVAAVPGFGGMLADRLPVQDALGAAGQGLLLCAIAGEYGLRGEDDQVRLLAGVLLRRDVEAELAAQRAAPAQPSAEVDREAAQLTAQLETSAGEHGGRPTVRAIVGTMWRLGRALWSLGDELDRRPQGRIYHRAFGMLPVFGVVGDYFGERHALRKVAKASRSWIVSHRASASGV